MPLDAQNLKWKLKELGLSDGAITAAWPHWWSDEAERSPSALNDLKFSVARKLGISPRSLFDEGEAKFVWRGVAKFKGLATRTTQEGEVLVAYASSVARLLLAATHAEGAPATHAPPADAVRYSLLESSGSDVDLANLLLYFWAVGIPVVHLRVFPLTAKRMAAMTVRVGSRYVVLLGADAQYPAPIAFNLAHELGHIAHGHIKDEGALIDEELLERTASFDDHEEAEADEYALTLLTGRPKPTIETTRPPRSPPELMNAVLKAGRLERIEPGTLALCYAHATGQWALANAALKYIYDSPRPVWAEVNSVASFFLKKENLTGDNVDFLDAVMGLSQK